MNIVKHSRPGHILDWTMFFGESYASPGLSVSIGDGRYHLTNLDFTFGGDDSDLLVGIGAYFFTLYISIRDLFPRSWRKASYAWAGKVGKYAYRIDPFQGRTTGVSIHDGCVWWTLWGNMDCMGNKNKGWPWLGDGWSWVWHVQDWLIGPARYEKEDAKPEASSVIMPEGAYPCTVKVYRCRWNRRFWKGQWYWRSNVEIPGGIPHPGKGENSWDCDDDATFGVSSAIEKDRIDPRSACDKVAMSVLRDRQRRGSIAWKPAKGWPEHMKPVE